MNLNTKLKTKVTNSENEEKKYNGSSQNLKN